MSHRTLLTLASSAFRLYPVCSLFLATALVLTFITGNSPVIRAQENSARISGIITDQQKAVIRNAKIDLINLDTGVHYPTVSNDDGVYVVSAPVGEYRLQVDHVGFKTVIAANIVLHTQDAREINFEMSVGSASETVTVNGSSTNDSPAVSMTVEREFIENMPLNGQSLQDLIQLAPGVVDATGSGFYTVNGQRQDSNNYTVDGVSANLGGFNSYAGLGGNGAGLSGASPSQTAIGTTQNLVSVDSLQEFTIQSSGYTAEYGRNPGGQVQFTTRPGTNDVHGSLFNYLRNTAFDANSYQNDYYDYPQTPEHQNDFGGTIGGPLIVPKLYSGKDRTFYFLSYEGLRLLLPNFESKHVPTQAFRSWASPNVQPFLNSAPLPNGPVNDDGCTVPGTTNACDALFNYGFSNPNNLDNYSGRLDQTFGKRFRAFVRYADTPSSSTYGADVFSTTSTNTHVWTAGLTANMSSDLLDEFRFNSSHDNEGQSESPKSLAGSIPFARNLLIPADYDTAFASASAAINLPGTSLRMDPIYYGGGTAQHQYELVNGLSWVRGRHTVKGGVDWRRITSTWTNEPYGAGINVSNLNDIYGGYATTLLVQANAPGQPVFDNLSLYAQDHWRISQSLSIDYGLRWEFNPPPGPSNGHYPVALTSSNLATATLTNDGTQPYKTDYHSFAPRLGFAWNLAHSQVHTMTVRGGFGIFFDTGQQTIGNSYASAYPFGATNPTQSELPLPLSAAALAPPSLIFPLIPPYPFLSGIVSPELTAPYTEQWTLSLDQALNAKNTLTESYVGNNGRKLLFTNYFGSVSGNAALANGLLFTTNEAHSSYNALQVQDTGRLANGLDIVASFTFAHALDNASNDYSGIGPFYGNSDNDLRRAFNLALNYQIPSGASGRWVKELTHGWLLANRFTIQSGNPLTIVQTYVFNQDGTQAEYYPDLIAGVPIYLHGRAADINGNPAPGNWRLNSAAFGLVPTDPATGNPIRQGTLGRNYVRTPSFWALNTSLQRVFPIYEQLHLNFRVDAFNTINHPNLDEIDNGLSDSTFGTDTGGTGTIGSSNQLYAMGAARSLQFSLKLQF